MQMALREAVVAVTYRCNCRCAMCNIWQVKDHNEMPANEYAKLPSTLRTINVTGGEPFLRKDLTDVVRFISRSAPRSRIVFSSNGYLTDKIVETMAVVRSFHPRVGIGISVDGTESTHDGVRGLSGCYAKAIQTVKSLKDEGFDDLRLGMTILERNADQIEDVFRLSKELGVEFTATVAHNSQIYFRRTDNQPFEAYQNRLRGLETVIDSQIHSKSVKNWFRGYHLEGLIDDSIRNSYAGHCSAGSRYVFISPSGDVYPCSVMDYRIGNITQVASWSELFNHDARMNVRVQVRGCRSDCWMVCNTRSLITRNPLKAAKWVLTRKLLRKPSHK